MTRLGEIIARGSIELGDDITFRTHADVLRLFGKDVKVMQKSFIRHPVEDNVWISFWTFYQDDANEWINTWSQTEDIAFEKRKINNEGYLADMASSPDKHTRVLFAKVLSGGQPTYRFKGVYTFDPELSEKAKKCAYRRVATSAKVYPVS